MVVASESVTTCPQAAHSVGSDDDGACARNGEGCLLSQLWVNNGYRAACSQSFPGLREFLRKPTRFALLRRRSPGWQRQRSHQLTPCQVPWWRNQVKEPRPAELLARATPLQWLYSRCKSCFAQPG